MTQLVTLALTLSLNPTLSPTLTTLRLTLRLTPDPDLMAVIYGLPARWMPLEGGKDFVDTLLSFDHAMGGPALHLSLVSALALGLS